MPVNLRLLKSDSYVPKSRLTRLLGGFLALAVLTGCGRGSIDEGTVISILYTSDTRGKLEGCGCKKSGGGITKRAARIESARAADPTVLYLDAGNFLSGTPEVDSTNGLAAVAVYNELGTSTVNVCERELQFGMDAYRAAKKQSKFDYVSANVRYRGGKVADPYVIKTAKNARIAIVGLCGTKQTMRYDSSKLRTGFTVEDPLTAAKRVIPSLEGKADITIVLSTCGDAVDSLLAQNFQMVVLIIGGRSYRPNCDAPWVLGNARIVRTQRDGRALGRMDLVFGPDRKIKTFSPSVAPLEIADPSSAKMLSVVRKYIPTFTDNPAEGVRIAGQTSPIPSAK